MSCNDIHVQSMRESSILTHVCPPICLSTPGGGTPVWCRQGGYPSQVQSDGGCYSSLMQAGGYPSQVQPDGGCYSSLVHSCRQGEGVSQPGAGRGVVPQPGAGRGVVLQPGADSGGGTPAWCRQRGWYSSLVQAGGGGTPTWCRQGVVLQPGPVLTIVYT